MSPMQRARSEPGHTILCVEWTQYPAAAEGAETWLAGCTCGRWSHRGPGPEVNTAWEKHLDEVWIYVPGPLARRIRLALDHAHRDAAPSIASYQALAGELIDCDGYPLDQEPWS